MHVHVWVHTCVHREYLHIEKNLGIRGGWFVCLYCPLRSSALMRSFLSLSFVLSSPLGTCQREPSCSLFNPPGRVRKHCCSVASTSLMPCQRETRFHATVRISIHWQKYRKEFEREKSIRDRKIKRNETRVIEQRTKSILGLRKWSLIANQIWPAKICQQNCHFSHLPLRNFYSLGFRDHSDWRTELFSKLTKNMKMNDLSSS